MLRIENSTPAKSIAGRKHSGTVAKIRRVPGVQYVYERKKNLDRREFVDAFIPKYGIGAELGVQKGYFSHELLSITKPTKLFLVDPWYLLGAEWEWSGGNRSTTTAVARIIERYSPQLVSGQIELVVANDLDFLDALEDESLDWAYIDSSHEYEHTVAELSLLQKKVKRSGVIAGDDWHDDPGHRHHGVARAVRELCEHSAYELIYSNDPNSQWAVSLAND